jgi:hypothetical protein
MTITHYLNVSFPVKIKLNEDCPYHITLVEECLSRGTIRVIFEEDKYTANLVVNTNHSKYNGKTVGTLTLMCDTEHRPAIQSIEKELNNGS